MASVAPTVTRTSVSGSSSRPYQARWCAATAWRSSGMPCARRVLVAPLADGVDRDLAQLVGAVGVGEALAEVDRARRRRQLGHGGEDRRGERAQAPGQVRASPRVPPRTMVPTAIRGRLSSGRTVLSIANYNMHCGMDGWGRPYDYSPRSPSFGADVIVLEEAWTAEGDDARARRRRRPRISATRSWRTRSAQGAASGPRPDAADSLDRPAGVDGRATGRSTWTACARSRRRCRRWRAGRRPSRARGASPCWCGRSSRSRRRGCSR